MGSTQSGKRAVTGQDYLAFGLLGCGAWGSS
jgi:hypothetical protein